MTDQKLDITIIAKAHARVREAASAANDDARIADSAAKAAYVASGDAYVALNAARAAYSEILNKVVNSDIPYNSNEARNVYEEYVAAQGIYDSKHSDACAANEVAKTAAEMAIKAMKTLEAAINAHADALNTHTAS